MARPGSGAANAASHMESEHDKGDNPKALQTNTGNGKDQYAGYPNMPGSTAKNC